METLKRNFMIFAVGGFVATFIVGLLAPKVLGWYWETPMNIGVSCKPAVEWGVERIQQLQLVSLVVGGVVNIILFATVFKGR